MTTHNPYGRGSESMRKACALAICKRCRKSAIDPQWLVECIDGLWQHHWPGQMPERCDAAEIWKLPILRDPEIEE